MKKRILLASMGGTIATIRDESGMHVIAARAAELAALPALSEMAEVVAVDVCQKLSHDINQGDQLRIAAVIRDAMKDGFHAVVVTHGTDTIEETAYSLALQIERGFPIVLTGAMRAPDLPGADGLANLVAAFAAAAAPGVGSLGPVVVFQDEIHAARFVTKASTARVAAFSSPGVGPLGEIVESVPRILLTPTQSDYIGAPRELHHRVEILSVATGTDGALVRAAAGIDTAGIVVAGTGGGHLPRPMAEACIELAKKGTPIVLASRTGSGTTLQSSYRGSVGSESELIEAGLIPAGWLSPAKARLRLLVGLALGVDPRHIFPV